MNEDPIVDEVRRAGEADFARFDFDIHSICEDLRRRSQEQGRKPISLPPRPAQPRPEQSKKVG